MQHLLMFILELAMDRIHSVGSPSIDSRRGIGPYRIYSVCSTKGSRLQFFGSYLVYHSYDHLALWTNSG